MAATAQQQLCFTGQGFPFFGNTGVVLQRRGDIFTPLDCDQSTGDTWTGKTKEMAQHEELGVVSIIQALKGALPAWVDHYRRIPWILDP